MKAVLAICLLIFGTVGMRAEWFLEENEAMGGPAGVEFERRMAGQDGKKVELHVVRFSSNKYTLAVMDNPAGALSLGSAAQKRGALAAVNGGYFHPDRTPLGLVIWQGQILHPLEKARLLSGLVVVEPNRISLLRVGEFRPNATILAALQAGPFLIDGGKPVVGLDAGREAARTVVFVDAAGRWGLLICRSASLAQTAQVLAARGVVGESRIIRALNLDGGSSSGLWVKGETPFYLREGKDVRNYLAIVAK